MRLWVRLASAACAFFFAAGMGGCLPSSRGGLDEEKEPHFMEGKSRVNRLDYRGAIQEYEKALELNPRSGAAHFELAWLYDQKEPDPAAAIYHYQRFLRLQPDSGKAEAARTRILACKQELAKGILPVAPASMQRDLDQLAAEHARLRDELERWRAYAIRMQMPTNPPSAATMQTHDPTPPPREISNVTPLPARQASADQSSVRAMRTHRVQQGETPFSISRKYGVKLDDFMAANPGLDPRRVSIGQAVNIPSP